MDWLTLLTLLVCDLFVGYEIGCYVTNRRVNKFFNGMIKSVDKQINMMKEKEGTNVESRKDSENC